MNEGRNWLHARVALGSHLGLIRIERLLERLNNPHHHLKMIHVAGTNGKGSTSTYIKEMMIASGYRVGSFITPYIESYEDQIQINHQSISLLRLESILLKIKPIVEEMDKDEAVKNITEFEILTAVMLYYFAKEKVDFVVVEVGIGGTLDSTNIITPLVSVISTIGYDHTMILGDTLTEIAENKAGIIKKGVPLITGYLPEEARHVIQNKVNKEGCKWYELGEVFYTDNEITTLSGSQFDYHFSTNVLSKIKLNLRGEYQIHNASLAITVIQLLHNKHLIQTSNKAIYSGLEKANIVGRMEVLCQKPLVMVDGAHNPQGIDALRDYVKMQFTDRNVYILFSAITTKDYHCMLEELIEVPVIQSITLTTFNHPNAMTEEVLLDLKNDYKSNHLIHVESNWKKAYQKLLRDMTEDEVLLITGSLYFISKIRPYILENKAKK